MVQAYSFFCPYWADSRLAPSRLSALSSVVPLRLFFRKWTVAFVERLLQTLGALGFEELLHRLGLMRDHVEIGGGLFGGTEAGHLQVAVDGGLVQRQQFD